MKIAVTGGSGELGTLVLRRLVADRKVKEVVSIDLRPPRVASSKLRDVRCDVRDPAIAGHFEGCAAVFHFAFLIATFPGRKEFDSVNVDGSKNVFRAAVKAGVPQVIYASSVAAYGVVPGHPVPIVETTPRVHQPDFAYSANKFEVEAFLDEFEKEHPSLVVARLRPCILIGARMEHPLGFTLKHRRIPETGQVFPLVWDEDVADAAILCLEKKAHGPFNLVADELLPVPELAAQSGFKVLDQAGAAVKTWSRIASLLARFKLANPTDPAWAEKGSVKIVASSEKAIRELGWKPKCPTAVSVMKKYAATVPQFLDPRIGAFMALFAVAARLKPRDAELGGFNSVVHVQLTGPRGGDFGVTARQGELRVALGAPRPPTAVVTLEARLFLDLLAGKADFATSQLTGAIRVEGEGHAGMIVNAMIAQWRAKAGQLGQLRSRLPAFLSGRSSS